MNRPVTIGFMLVIIIALLVAIWYVWGGLFGDRTPSEDSYALEARAEAARIAGEYAEAAGLFENAAEVSDATDRAAELLVDAAISSYHTGAPNATRKGVEQLASVAGDQSVKPEVRSRAVAVVAGMICDAGCDQAVFDTVFAATPFASYKAEGDMQQSVMNLYEHSLELAPQSLAHVGLASMLAERVHKGATDEEYASLEAQIVGHLTAADLLMPEEGLDQRDNMAFYVWKGYSYGALATVEPEQYEDLFAVQYETALGVGGPHPAGGYVNEVLTLMYYQYAALLNRAYGEASAASIVGNLGKVVEIVDTDPTPESNQFLRVVANEKGEPEGERRFMGSALDALAAQHQNFSSLIN